MSALTLEEALTVVATSSFYEDKLVTPVEGGYSISESTGWHDETVYWGPSTDWPKEALDHSRLHESYESYATAEHIRYNLETAVEALEEGRAVAFQYVVVNAYECSECAPDADLDDCEHDQLVGWALLAYEEDWATK